MHPLFAAVAAAAAFVNGPYLQRLSATSVEIRAELEAPAPATVELIGPADKKRTVEDAAASFHVVRIEGLQPQSTYRYRVRVGTTASPEGKFTTAPPDDSRAPFSFIVYGDTRSNDRAHAAIVRSMGEQTFDFLVNTGDFVAAGGERGEWRSFFGLEADLLRDHCVFACIGNHELVADEAATNFFTYFGSADARDAGMVPLYGTFRWTSTRFFLLNAFQDWSGGELSWLQRELDAADEEPGIEFRLVVVHHSPWSSGRHGDDTRMLAAGVPELLVRHHVDLVLAGHDHMYERGEWKGLKYVISGGGGAPLYTDITPKPSSRRAEASFNFVRATVDGDAMKLVARRTDGTTIESCGFHHGESWGCDAKTPPTATAAPAVSEAPSTTTAPTDSGPTKSSRCACNVPGAPSPTRYAALGSLAAAVAALRARRKRSRGRPASRNWGAIADDSAS